MQINVNAIAIKNKYNQDFANESKSSKRIVKERVGRIVKVLHTIA